MFVTVLIAITLSVSLTREVSEKQSVSITNKTWETAPPLRQRIDLLPDAMRLHKIWSDTKPSPPAQILKGGVYKYKAIEAEFKDMGYSTQRGIVLAAGGFHYFASAYVLVRQLRLHGCTLPIEWWYRRGELNDQHINYLRPWGVVCLNLDRLVPFKIQHQFSIKVLAMYLSCFKEFMFLDADNNVLRDPTYLFDTPEYQTTGALFWPDFWPLHDSAPCYLYFPKHVKKRLNKFQQESGQLLVNKTLYWAQLWFVFRILENRLESMFPAPYNFGDKDIFHITWNACEKPFSFVSHRVKAIATHYKNEDMKQVQTIAMGQCDPQGQLLFVHQNHAEWGNRKDTNPWWVLLKEHTDPEKGGVEAGTWNPTGPTRVSYFRDVIGTIEDDYVGFMPELRAEQWYQDFYEHDLRERGLYVQK